MEKRQGVGEEEEEEEEQEEHVVGDSTLEHKALCT